MDVEWADAYYDAQRKRIQRQIDRSYADPQAIEDLERDRAHLIDLISASQIS